MRNLVTIVFLLLSFTLPAQMAEDEFVLIETNFYKDKYFTKKAKENSANYRCEVYLKGDLTQKVYFRSNGAKVVQQEISDLQGIPHGKWLITNASGFIDTLDYDFELEEFYHDSSICERDNKRLDSLIELGEYQHSELIGATRDDLVMSIYYYISRNTRYPASAKDKLITGTTYLEFAIEANAEVKQYSILKGSHPILDKEGLRVIRSLEFSKPAIWKGEAVRECFTLPIKFNLR